MQVNCLMIYRILLFRFVLMFNRINAIIEEPNIQEETIKPEIVIDRTDDFFQNNYVNGTVPLWSGNLTDSQRLFRDLFKNYDRQLRPVLDEGRAVNVMMKLWFKQILKIDEIDQILTIYCWVEEYWRDEFLRWDPAKYNGLSVLRIPAHMLWRPDILVYNNADMNLAENELATNVVLNHTGDVICFKASIYKITCQLEMQYFPFDKQSCHMMFSSWSYDGTKVYIQAKTEEGFLKYYIPNTEWKLIDFYHKNTTVIYPCCPEPYMDIKFIFDIERNPSYYTLNLIIPSILITIVTMVGFFTPYSSTGENTEKVSLGVTALLSLAIILLMVADKMPATSKVIPLIGKYYMGLIFWIFVAAIVTTGTLKIQSKGNSGKPLHPSWKRFFFNYVARCLLMHIDIPVYPVATSDNVEQLGDSKHARTTQNGSINRQYQETSFLLADVRDSAATNSKSAQVCRKRLNSEIGRSQPSQSFSSTKLFDPLLTSPPGALGAAIPNSPLMTSPDDIWVKPSTVAQSTMANTKLEVEILSCLNKIKRTLRNFDRRITDDGRLETIKKEWELLARICERALMYGFIIGCLAFAVAMLYTPGPSRLLSW